MWYSICAIFHQFKIWLWSRYKPNKNILENLKTIRPGDQIFINNPPGFVVKVDTATFKDAAAPVIVLSNDPIAKKMWISFQISSSGTRCDFIFSYSSAVFKNYTLLNIKTKLLFTKEELSLKLQKAVDNGDYEMASLINKKLKSLND